MGKSNRDLTESYRLMDEVHKNFFAALDKETDRGLALVGAEVLCHALGELLRFAFGDHDPKAVDRLLKQSLQHFQPRITMCLVLGLITRHTAKQLNLIVEVRNQFAHTIEPLSFQHPSIKCLVGEMRGLFFVFQKIAMDERSTRDRFRNTVLCLHAHLHYLTEFVEQRTAWPTGFDLSLMTQAEREAASQYIESVFEDRAPRPPMWFRVPLR